MSAWAEVLARRVLSPLGQRWRHAEAVADTARDLAKLLAADDSDVLVAAAYLHDIGYALELESTGFHPLDGARHLRSLGHDRVAGLVAHHTRAVHEGRLRGLEKAMTEFDDEGSLVSAALAYCDLTAGPNGERMTPEQRLIDVEGRYGEDSPVTNGLRAAWPELMADSPLDPRARRIPGRTCHPTQWLNERDPDATTVDLVLLHIEYTDQNAERQSAYYRLSTHPDSRFQSQRRVSPGVAADFLQRAVIGELHGFLPATTEEQIKPGFDDFVCPDEIENSLAHSEGRFVGFSPDPGSGLPELPNQPRSAPTGSQETLWLERCPSLTAPDGN